MKTVALRVSDPVYLHITPPADAATCPALAVRGITAGYPGQRRAIEDVSFDVQRGQHIAIIGPNGAGKSTLFKALVGLIPHSTGSISLHGEDCRTSHRLLAYVPQHEAIDWTFPVTVEDVVMMGRARKIGWLRWPSRDDRQAVEAALDQVGMRAFRHRQIGQLSGGQKRRVFIARALAQDTDVLLLDEPFSGVDVAAEQEIMDTLDALKQMGITILLATHDLNAATRFDRVLILKNGVIAYGDPQAVFNASNLRRAYGDRVSVVGNGGETLIINDSRS